MTKNIKIFSIILIIFSIMLSSYGVLATNIDMNLVDNSTTTDAPEQTTTDTTTTTTSDTSIFPSNVNAIEEEGLSTSNIISILLITVGVILILLAIAIIIRLK